MRTIGVNSNTMLDISTQKYLNTALAKRAVSSPQKLAPQAKLLNLKLVLALMPKHVPLSSVRRRPQRVAGASGLTTLGRQAKKVEAIVCSCSPLTCSFCILELL